MPTVTATTTQPCECCGGGSNCFLDCEHSGGGEIMCGFPTFDGASDPIPGPWRQKSLTGSLRKRTWPAATDPRNGNPFPVSPCADYSAGIGSVTVDKTIPPPYGWYFPIRFQAEVSFWVEGSSTVKATVVSCSTETQRYQFSHYDQNNQPVNVIVPYFPETKVDFGGGSSQWLTPGQSRGVSGNGQVNPAYAFSVQAISGYFWAGVEGVTSDPFVLGVVRPTSDVTWTRNTVSFDKKEAFDPQCIFSQQSNDSWPEFPNVPPATTLTLSADGTRKTWAVTNPGCSGNTLTEGEIIEELSDQDTCATAYDRIRTRSDSNGWGPCFDSIDRIAWKICAEGISVAAKDVRFRAKVIPLAAGQTFRFTFKWGRRLAPPAPAGPFVLSGQTVVVAVSQGSGAVEYTPWVNVPNEWDYETTLISCRMEQIPST